MKSNRRLKVISKYASIIEKKHYDSSKSLLGKVDIERYTCDPEYLDKYFDKKKLEKNSLHSYRESIGLCFFLFFTNSDLDKANKILSEVLNGQNRSKTHKDYGGMHWYSEETRIRDANGNFFIGSVLLLILFAYPELITLKNKGNIKKTLSLLYPVFKEENTRCSLTYVNPTIGIKSMLYLLSELFFCNDEQKNKKDLKEYIEFLMKNGINESYTPTYYGVTCNVLFMVLLITKDAGIQKACWKILDEIILKEKAFFGNRFPAPFRRGYNNKYRTNASDISSFMFGYLDDYKPEHFDIYSTFAAAPLCLLIEEKFGKHWPKVNKYPRELKGVIFKDCVATSYMTKSYLLGTVNDYPPITTVWQTVATGGAGWQDGCYYFTSNSKQDISGILRLEAVDKNNKKTFHPVREKYSRYVADRIYPFISFPPEPKIKTLQHKGNAICLFKTDRIDAELKRFGFNILFSRFKGHIYSPDGQEIIVNSRKVPIEKVILELPETWIYLIGLSRVDMGKSDLLKSSFIKPSFELKLSKEGLNCQMYNYNGKLMNFVQNHVSGGFVMVVKEKSEFKSRKNFLDYVNNITVKEHWYSAHINAHIDNRDSIRNVYFNDGCCELELEWDHYSNNENVRKINKCEIDSPKTLRSICYY